LYGVTTQALNQTVNRNSARFPEYFAFLLTPEEKTEAVTNCDNFCQLKFTMVPPGILHSGSLKPSRRF